MSGKRPKYYWDSCVFLAFLKNEVVKHPVEVPIIGELMAANSTGGNTVLGSQMVRLEVLEWSLGPDARRSFDAFYQQNYNDIYDVDSRVATLAREIRDYYKASPIDPMKTRTMGLPDAVHIATAIIHNADEFHTLDGGGQDGFSLLALSGNVAGYDLTICPPRLPAESVSEEEATDEDGGEFLNLFGEKDSN